MSGQGWAMKGECRCGKVQFRITAPPVMTMACHCRGCQQMTAGAFSLSALVPATGFEVTQGEPVIGGLHGATRHFFCPHCLSWLFTRPEGADEFVNVRSPLLDDPEAFPPFIETMTREKLSWATTPAAHTFEDFPSMQEYPALMGAFAATLSPPPAR